MATDLEQIVRNLAAFYDVAGKKVVYIGAGGGQLVEFVRHARQVIAVDSDGPALERLATRIAGSGLAEGFSLLQCDVLEAREPGDVVYLEFCLHQMADPGRVLDHARTLADDVLVADHAVSSPWLWYAAEDDRLEAAWQAVAQRRIHRQRAFEAEQRFTDYVALESKLAAQGPQCIERIGAFRDTQPITIAMPYRLALL